MLQVGIILKNVELHDMVLNELDYQLGLAQESAARGCGHKHINGVKCYLYDLLAIFFGPICEDEVLQHLLCKDVNDGLHFNILHYLSYTVISL